MNVPFNNGDMNPRKRLPGGHPYHPPARVRPEYHRPRGTNQGWTVNHVNAVGASDADHARAALTSNRTAADRHQSDSRNRGAL